MKKSTALVAENIIPFKLGGKVNPKRGESYVEHAVAFAKLYPIGKSLSAAEWDNFLVARNLLTRPNEGADAWMGHVVRRNRLRRCINMAAQHPTMRGEHNVPTYLIEPLGWSRQHAARDYAVRAAYSRATGDGMGRYMKAKLTLQRKQLDIALQGVDVNDLTPLEQMTVKQAAVHGDLLAESIQFNVDQYMREMARITKEVLAMTPKTPRIEP